MVGVVYFCLVEKEIRVHSISNPHLVKDHEAEDVEDEFLRTFLTRQSRLATFSAALSFEYARGYYDSLFLSFVMVMKKNLFPLNSIRHVYAFDRSSSDNPCLFLYGDYLTITVSLLSTAIVFSQKSRVGSLF